MKTVAEQIGQTPHLSPLLRRLRRIGLTDPDDLRRLAVARGCWHYRQPDDDLAKRPWGPNWENISDLEIAMGMLSAKRRSNLSSWIATPAFPPEAGKPLARDDNQQVVYSGSVVPPISKADISTDGAPSGRALPNGFSVSRTKTQLLLASSADVDTKEA